MKNVIQIILNTFSKKEKKATMLGLYMANFTNSSWIEDVVRTNRTYRYQANK
jgi:hypothetical protein